KIYDVAENVGYLNVKHFSSTFKNYFNVTPGEYLESYYKKNKTVIQNR
ncbi:MAG: Helix-turn-helix domain, partial [Clostridiaceae bacterium]|nr:Helix-turn-helix domain [Clostridiaceae bacterium]